MPTFCREIRGYPIVYETLDFSAKKNRNNFKKSNLRKESLPNYLNSSIVSANWLSESHDFFNFFENHWISPTLCDMRFSKKNVSLSFITKRTRSSLGTMWKSSTGKGLFCWGLTNTFITKTHDVRNLIIFFGSVSTIKVTVISSAQLQFFYSSHLVKRIHWVSCWCYVKQLIPAWVQDNQKLHDFSWTFGLF